MALTVSQYNSIMRQYEERQTRNRHLQEERLRHIYDTVEGYRAIDESVASVSVAQGKKMLAGDTSALDTLREKLRSLSSDRARLLEKNGYPSDFLKPVYDCPDCHDTGYVNGQKCHCFRQAEITLLYEQSNLKQVLEKENFSTLSYEWFQGESETVTHRDDADFLVKDYLDNAISCYQDAYNYGATSSQRFKIDPIVENDKMVGYR